MFDRLKIVARNIAREVRVCQAILGDRRTPWLARILLGCGIAYALSPIDLIPDFIPVVGHLDDAILVPALILLGLRLVPKEVVQEHRESLRRDSGGYYRVAGDSCKISCDLPKPTIKGRKSRRFRVKVLNPLESPR